MSTRAYVRRRAQRQPVVDADVASEHPSIQPVSPSPAPTSSLPASPSLDGEERMTHDFSQIAVQPAPAPASPLAPQLKRRLSQPGDPHEQEARAPAWLTSALKRDISLEYIWRVRYTRAVRWFAGVYLHVHLLLAIGGQTPSPRM